MSEPIRMCVACRAKKNKSKLLRIVFSCDNQLMLDYDARAQGRGAYICNSTECLDKTVTKKLLNRHYKRAIPDIQYARMKESYVPQQD